MLAALLLVGVGAQAQMETSIPVDKDVRIGKLSNGLTYYIRHNNWPENRANFYIAQASTKRCTTSTMCRPIGPEPLTLV